MKRIGTTILCFVMLFALLAFPGFATETEETTAAASSEDLTLRGYQNQLNTTGAETVSVRIIAEIANVDSYAEVGFRITTAKKGEMNLPVTTVYSKLTAGRTDDDGTTFAEEITPAVTGNYLFALILTDINVSADAALTVVPYAVDKDGATVVGGSGDLQKPAGEASFAANSTYRVTFKTGDGEEISTVSVKRGENAPLPAAKDGYYWTVDLAELVNITENKTITLGQVATSAYANDKTVTKISTTSANEAVNSEKYALTLGTINESGTQPNQNTSWTFLYQLGQTLQFTADFADTLLLKMRCQDATSMTVAVYVDGYLIKNVTVNSVDQKSTTNLTVGELIPAGEHTVRLVVTDLVGTPTNIRGFCINEIHIKEKV